MKKFLFLLPLILVCALVPLLRGEDLPVGTYRKSAPEEKITEWERQFFAKRHLVPPPPPPRESSAEAVDFSGRYRFGRYDYDLVIEQKGDEITMRSGGVDHQDIGGPFDTIGVGVVRNGRIRARWWCIALDRNYANNGGAELWFTDDERERIYVRYYHDADEKMEDGYGVRVGTHEKEQLHYRIRMKHPVKQYPEGLVLRGTVRGRDGEVVPDAVVMLRHEEKSAVRTDAEGRWEIRVTRLPAVQMVSAAAPGYRNAVEAILFQDVRELDFRLEASPWSDDPRYEFVDPTPEMKDEIFRCGNCHRTAYAEWKDSRHALAARSAITTAVYERDFLPAVRVGMASGDEGLCAACHAPQAALDGKSERLNEVSGLARLGNHCDFCHKVHHTEDLEAAGARGSLALGRPSPDDERVPGPIKRIYGPLPDSDYLFMGPVYNPFFNTSALCAGCHQYTNERGIPALATYDEWQAWAAGRQRHESCQTCHMPTGVSKEGKRLARRICVNALRRPEEQIHDHAFRGREMAPDAVTLATEARRDGDRLDVVTTVGAKDDAGHRVPTGSGDKHLVLVVLAFDEQGRAYPLAEGSRVPAHAGGDGVPEAAAVAARLEAHDFAGLPGREFAQVLADTAGNTHVPFWRATRVVEDTRLEPGKPVTVKHAFAVPAGRAARVRAVLWHRARFKAHDVARGVAGEGVRPLDLELASVERRIP